MNKKLVLLGVVLLLPLHIFALDNEKYNVLNLKETLIEENIEPSFDDYSENDDQITIYMFRGEGCTHCIHFLSFLNDIAPEYGKYFKLKSFEVWHDSENAGLMGLVSNHLGKTSTGVPYIIIGDKVFTGYAERYNDSIKDTIINLYNTDKEDRYDVFIDMDNSDTSNNNPISKIIFYSVLVITFIIVSIINYKRLKKYVIE